MRLGSICEHFESGGGGPGTISSGVGDPGGKSYGIYQFSNVTLASYLSSSYFKFPVEPIAFDVAWKQIALRDPEEFTLDQHVFAVRSFYLPVTIFAKRLGFETKDVRIQEALFSGSIQHGKIAQIVRNTSQLFPLDVDQQIHSFYKARSDYVSNLKLNPELLKLLLRRYEEELRLVLTLVPAKQSPEADLLQAAHSQVQQ